MKDREREREREGKCYWGQSKIQPGQFYQYFDVILAK